MEVPTVDEVKDSRIGKSLNKIVKSGGYPKIVELAQKVMSKWKKSWEGPQEMSLGKRSKKTEPEFEEKIKRSKKRVRFLDQKP